MKYRPEIDGLRALAVLPVIFFHAGFKSFGGGFVGVDVFFVISGYLITRLLQEELSRGDFSLARFYARRARRILPALFTVILACIPVAWLWMLPSQYEQFSRSLIAVVLFVSNILFWNESGYFAAAAEEKPLLHTWSLGVEEQFYIFFPLALMLCWHFGKRRVFYGIVVVGIVSLALCEYASRTYISANFFLIPTRAWELLAGSICALLHAETEGRKNDGLSLLGVGLIFFAVMTYGEQMRLPSAYTLVPVLGTVLILLYGGAGSIVARILSLRIFVGIGLISYSAYLWHQPLFAFARIRNFHGLDSATMPALAFFSLALAALTWRFIEQPFRHKQHPRFIRNRPALYAACAVALLLMAIGAHGHFTQGRLDNWMQQVRPEQLRAYTLLEDAKKQSHQYDNGDCVFQTMTLSDATQSRILACHKKYRSGIAVIGDSHAMDLFFVFKHQPEKLHFLVGISDGGCRAHSSLPSCHYYERLLQLLEREPSLFQQIIYEQTGVTLLNEEEEESGHYPNIERLPLDKPVPDYPVNAAYVDRVASYLSEAARYSKVIWLGPRFEPRISTYTMIQKGCDYPFASRPQQLHLYEKLDEALRLRTESTAIDYRSQIKIMQFEMKRDFISCDKTYFSDGHHFSPEGEKHFAERMTLQKLIEEK